MRPDAQSELLAAALKTSSEVHFATDFKNALSNHVRSDDSFVVKANAGTAYAALHVLKQQGWRWSEDALSHGLKNHTSLTGQLGRWQCVELPTVLLWCWMGPTTWTGSPKRCRSFEPGSINEEGRFTSSGERSRTRTPLQSWPCFPRRLVIGGVRQTSLGPWRQRSWLESNRSCKARSWMRHSMRFKARWRMVRLRT